ncbi:hypothetical protein [Clostridium polynesiense]|uniref:hypothetical protein n=1 Tax=Clostridium polynesiense TaxID=1325933 RepID=UPI00058DE11E|nr:hypothetical protein [Clostridium polynesiense]
MSIYTSFKCKCGREFVLLSEEVQSMKGYLVCPYCSGRGVKKEKATNSLKECMSARAYIRVNGYLRQK